MKVLIQLAVLTVAAAYPAAQLPPGGYPAACPNYPYCDAVTRFNYAPGIAAERIAYRTAGEVGDVMIELPVGPWVPAIIMQHGDVPQVSLGEIV